eukprot:scaffold4224_cov55-Attheya_sp.AAC.1
MPIEGGVGGRVLRSRVGFTHSRHQQKNNFNVMTCRDTRTRARMCLGNLQGHTSTCGGLPSRPPARTQC